MGVDDIEVIATAAVRGAKNGDVFLDAARDAIQRDISLLSGRREAELSALGVISAIHEPDGVVGDLGGGSLELIDVHKETLGKGITLPLGGLALMDASRRSMREATRIARKAIADAKPLDHLKGRTFYAVGGTWRSLAKLHMRQRNYALGVMHHYRIQTSEAADFAELVEHIDSEALEDIDFVSAARRPLLAYGAIVLDEIIRRAKPREIVISAAGVREGMLYERLSSAERRVDPLLAATRELEVTFARAPGYGDDLIDWTDAYMEKSGIDETDEERRLRHAACLLSDIAWRAHPEYRAQRAMNIVTQGPFVAIDHPGRAFLSLAIVFRHEGLDGVEGLSDLRTPADDASVRARAHSRGAHAGRLFVVSVDARRAAAHALAGLRSRGDAHFACRLRRSCERARAQSSEGARQAHGRRRADRGGALNTKAVHSPNGLI